ncbi:MAG: type II 3-dehydroquinate dehydratase [Duncaniella sp.]|nr:type II 3-dehydroquinate dehydratase [Duncaniella sp.]MDE5751892.1 type II 3-dehydroquinate dehydratase [Duncaniella sp.]MDE5917884.1 type II 3-dehydroquinate dehydratase [Duncaniella sp.]MDE6171460.1 type II 3-dehydroquinate dehydratase [Duncaniella sp.]MDE6326997.1 type II 3-dehydroquinate dehydratase [Duncaniella sp.]
MKILIINGPNLNLLGTREPEIYGSRSFESYLPELREMLDGDEIEYLQSNHEGEIIDFLHEADCDGIILNAGAYTHTSLAIADAISAIQIPVIEVHISNIASRESIRHTSLIAPVCQGSIAGFGLNSYFLAAQAIIMDPSR